VWQVTRFGIFASEAACFTLRWSAVSWRWWRKRAPVLRSTPDRCAGKTQYQFH